MKNCHTYNISENLSMFHEPSVYTYLQIMCIWIVILTVPYTVHQGTTYNPVVRLPTAFALTMSDHVRAVSDNKCLNFVAYIYNIEYLIAFVSNKTDENYFFVYSVASFIRFLFDKAGIESIWTRFTIWISAGPQFSNTQNLYKLKKIHL